MILFLYQLISFAQNTKITFKNCNEFNELIRRNLDYEKKNSFKIYFVERLELTFRVEIMRYTGELY